MYLKLVSLKKLEKLEFFKYSHRKPWIKVSEELATFILKGIIFSIVFSFVEAAMLGGDALENFGNSLYYLVTSITTIGYGDLSPKTFIGKLLFAGYICFYGVYKMVHIAEMIISAKQHKKLLKNNGRLFMPYNNHILAFFDAKSLSSNEFLFLRRFIAENLKSNKFKNHKIVLINSNTQLNKSLNHFLEANDWFGEMVSLINADIYEEGIFDKLSINKAKHIYVFNSNDNTMITDSKVLDTVMRIRSFGYDSNNIAVEIIDDKFRDIIKMQGVNTIIRPTRSYPELFVRSSVAEGSEKMLEELLSSRGDSTATFKLERDSFCWSDALYTMSKNDVGTPLAVIFKDGTIDTNPTGSKRLENVSKMLVMISDFDTKEYNILLSQINNLINDLA